MNYLQELNLHLHSLHCELWDLSGLIPEQFILKAQPLANTGYENNLIGMILQGIRQYRYQRAILKYIRIVDKLLKLKPFAVALQYTAHQIFYETFVSFWNQKCFNEIEEIKILRKFWVGALHPQVLAKMRETILVATGCDVDSGFKPEVIISIKQFYEQRLKMNPEQVRMFLPTEGRRDKEVYRNFQSFREAKRSPPTEVLEFFQQPENQLGFMKRNRQNSQHSRDTDLVEEPRKKVHIDPTIDQIKTIAAVKPKYQILLQSLSSINTYLCRLCGKSFSVEENYNAHLQGHFLQNRRNYEIKLKKRGNSRENLACEDEWIESSQKVLQLNRYCVPSPEGGLKLYKSQNSQYICPLCGNIMTQQFADAKWVFSSAAKVQFNTQLQLQIIHKSCLSQLENVQ